MKPDTALPGSTTPSRSAYSIMSCVGSWITRYAGGGQPRSTEGSRYQGANTAGLSKGGHADAYEGGRGSMTRSVISDGANASSRAPDAVSSVKERSATLIARGPLFS